jgi:Rhodopirellula transposase DDE domain
VGAKKFYHRPNEKNLLIDFIDRHKAGSSTNPDVYWIHLKPREISAQFEVESGIKVCRGQVKKVLNELGYKYRKLSKQIALADYQKRNEQMLFIFRLVALMSLQSPIISIDCKKKERLGNLYRAGKCYATAPIEVLDHDYDNLSEGKVIPHGIYDLQANIGYITIGNSAETADFIVDNLRWWWTEYGIHLYPDATNLLLLCDAGGGNSYRHHIFKIRLQALAKELGISFIVAHYPPYTSKWNLIEHRLFCHLHQAMQGVVFTDYDIVKTLCEKTQTKTGLRVVVRLNLKNYPTKLKVNKNEIDLKRIDFDKNIPALNYRIYP